MPKRTHNDKLDTVQEAVRQVNELTDSEPVNGEDLLKSPKLKRQLRAAKARVSTSAPKAK